MLLSRLRTKRLCSALSIRWILMHKEHAGTLCSAPQSTPRTRTMVQRSTQHSARPSPPQWSSGTPVPDAQPSLPHTPRIQNRPFSLGHYPDYCRRAHLEHIHAALITHTVQRRLQTFSLRRHTPSQPFSVAHCPCPQYQRQRMVHWGLGRAVRGAGEAEPASGPSSLAGSPPARGPR